MEESQTAVSALLDGDDWMQIGSSQSSSNYHTDEVMKGKTTVCGSSIFCWMTGEVHDHWLLQVELQSPWSLFTYIDLDHDIQ